MSVKMVTVTLDHPIARGESEIAEVTVRKPAAGELRGLSLAKLSQMDTDTLLTVLPRITTPPLTAAEVAALEVEDLVALSIEVADFLLPAKARAEAEAAGLI